MPCVKDGKRKRQVALMADITFCRPVHNYESYADFWTLVSLSDFPIISVSDLDISQEGVFITAPMNEDWREHINEQHKQKRPVYAHLIHWNLERPSGSAGSVGNYAKQNTYLKDGLWPNGERTKRRGDGQTVTAYGRFIDENWTSDRRLADETQLRFVVLGSDTGLGSPGNEKQYSFCHMSYEVPRRGNIYKHFLADQIAPNCWPPERDKVLGASRFALNVHQDIHPFQEPLRLALFAAYGLPIISETIFDIYPWSEEMIITVGYDNLASKLREALISDYEPYREMGLRARERMTGDFNFKKCVLEAIEQSVNRWR